MQTNRDNVQYILHWFISDKEVAEIYVTLSMIYKQLPPFPFMLNYYYCG